MSFSQSSNFPASNSQPILSTTFKAKGQQNSKKGSFVLKKKNLNGEPDMRYKENRDQFLEPGLNVDGTPDMRLLENRIQYGLYKD